MTNLDRIKKEKDTLTTVQEEERSCLKSSGGCGEDVDIDRRKLKEVKTGGSLALRGRRTIGTAHCRGSGVLKMSWAGSWSH